MHRKEWPSRYFPTPYCKDDNGNWTGGKTYFFSNKTKFANVYKIAGTILINIYEGFDYNYSTPIKAYLGLKFNAACQTECNDWIQLTISSSRDFITREYFYEDPSTTVINGIRDSISGYRNKAVNFVMVSVTLKICNSFPNPKSFQTLRNRPSAAAIVENQDLVVSAKLEKETTGNRVMKVIAYPNTGQPVVIADANI